MPTISSSRPCLFCVKTEWHSDIFSLLKHALRETCSTVDWLAYCRLERHHSSFTAFSAFNLKHPLLKRVESPLLAPCWNWKYKFPIITIHNAHNTHKGFHLSKPFNPWLRILDLLALACKTKARIETNIRFKWEKDAYHTMEILCLTLFLNNIIWRSIATICFYVYVRTA